MAVLIQPPTTIPLSRPGPGSTAFGEGPGGCNPFVYAIVGAIAFWAIPPLLSGMIDGGMQAWRERKD